MYGKAVFFFRLSFQIRCNKKQIEIVCPVARIRKKEGLSCNAYCYRFVQRLMFKCILNASVRFTSFKNETHGYPKGRKYLDSDSIFIILLLYTTGLKLSSQDVEIGQLNDRQFQLWPNKLKAIKKKSGVHPKC